MLLWLAKSISEGRLDLAIYLRRKSVRFNSIFLITVIYKRIGSIYNFTV